MSINVVPDEVLVGGVWRRGGGDPIKLHDPSDSTVLAELHAADRADVDEAVRLGEAAAADPRWRGMLPHERARVLARIADAIESGGDAIARLQTANTGKTLAETSALVASAAGTFRYFAAVLETMEGALTPSGAAT